MIYNDGDNFGNRNVLKFEAEFDFEMANAQFDKIDIEKEIKEKLSLGMFEKVLSHENNMDNF